MRTMTLTCAALLLGCATAPAQSALANRIFRVQDGTVRLSYAVKDGICGDGESFIRDRSHGENNYISWNEGDGRSSSRHYREANCDYGPARVAISKSGGMITRIRVNVGGEWRPGGDDVTDLGALSGPEAARTLLAVAAKERRANKAIFAAMIADSATVWPDLLAMAKNDELYKDTRKEAVFWLSQEASDAATKGLTEIAENDGDRELRDQAVFALSQLPSDQGVPVLIRLAKTNKDRQVRKKAIFWLGQSDDPRALKLFEELLTEKR